MEEIGYENRYPKEQIEEEKEKIKKCRQLTHKPCMSWLAKK